MSEASLSVGKAGKDRYKLAFETDTGKVVCEVSVRQSGKRDTRTEDERRIAALHAAKRLVRAFCEGIPEE